MNTSAETDTGGAARGFTLVDTVVVVVVVIAIALIGLGIHAYSSATRSARISGAWTIKPATIPSSGGQFTYSVKVKIGGQLQPLSGRKLSFRVEPAAHLTVSPVSGTTQPGGDLVVTVTPAQDYCYGGNLWVKDVKSGREDPPLHFTVTCP